MADSEFVMEKESDILPTDIADTLTAKHKGKVVSLFDGKNPVKPIDFCCWFYYKRIVVYKPPSFHSF